MLRRIVLQAFLAALATARAVAGDAQVEARAALAGYFTAVKAGDWGAIYDRITQESRGGQSREEFTRAREGGLGAELGKAIQARASYEIGAVQVAEGGETATGEVTIHLPDLRGGSGSLPTPSDIERAPLHSLQRSMQLAREGGAWKIVRPRASLSPEAMERLQRAARDSIERSRESPTSPPGTSD
jgi:hypothetical protein